VKKLPSVKVNIVEEEGWKPWSYEERFGELVADFAGESTHELKVDDITEYLEELIKPTRGPMSRKRWSVVTQEDLGRAAQAMKDGELESTRMMFQDAAQWMWEEAGTPTDRDIEHAMDAAREESYVGHLRGEWDEFSEIHGTEANRIAKKLVEAASYEREQNYYDRYIVLSWDDVPEAKAFVKWLVKSDYMTEGMAIDLLRDQLQGISDDFVHDTLKALQHGLEDMDWNNRAKWKKHWEASKKEHGKAVISEILEWFEKEKAEA